MSYKLYQKFEQYLFNALETDGELAGEAGATPCWLLLRLDEGAILEKKSKL